VRLVDRIGRALKLPSLPADLSLDSATDVIISRLEELCQSQTASESETSSLVYSLRHKLKRLKEKLTDKVSKHCSTRIFAFIIFSFRRRGNASGRVCLSVCTVRALAFESFDRQTIFVSIQLHILTTCKSRVIMGSRSD